MEVVGWRSFKEGANGLTGSAYSYNWRPGTNVAQCWSKAIGFAMYPRVRNEEGCDPSPGEDCPTARWFGAARGCGFYSWLRGPPEHYDRCLVMGLVVAWGRVIVHEKGMRAQYARIAALSDRGGKAVFRPLSEYGVLYGVPVVKYRTLCDSAFASEFGEILD